MRYSITKYNGLSEKNNFIIDKFVFLQFYLWRLIHYVPVNPQLYTDFANCEDCEQVIKLYM